MQKSTPLPKIKDDDGFYKLLLLTFEGKATAVGLRTTEGKSIVIVYEDKICKPSKTPFSCIEHSNEFELIIVSNDLPKDLQEFIGFYETSYLLPRKNISFLLGQTLYSLIYATQKSHSGISAFYKFLLLKLKNFNK